MKLKWRSFAASFSGTSRWRSNFHYNEHLILCRYLKFTSHVARKSSYLLARDRSTSRPCFMKPLSSNRSLLLFVRSASIRFFHHSTCYCTVENRAIPYVRILDRFSEYHLSPSAVQRAAACTRLHLASPSFRCQCVIRHNLISRNWICITKRRWCICALRADLREL